MSIPVITLDPSPYGAERPWASQHVLNVSGARKRDRNGRFGLGFVAPGQEARKVFQGPLEPGPWAYTFQHCTVIDNFGGTAAESRTLKACGLEHDVKVGEVVAFVHEDTIYKFRLVENRYGDLGLDLVATYDIASASYTFRAVEV